MSKRFIQRGITEQEELEGVYWWNTTTVIIDTLDGVAVGWDGGEPEDQVLYRDWDWVVGALNKAYNEGVAAGQGRMVSGD